jgi:hypothetical protein
MQIFTAPPLPCKDLRTPRSSSSTVFAELLAPLSDCPNLVAGLVRISRTAKKLTVLVADVGEDVYAACYDVKGRGECCRTQSCRLLSSYFFSQQQQQQQQKSSACFPSSASLTSAEMPPSLARSLLSFTLALLTALGATEPSSSRPIA